MKQQPFCLQFITHANERYDEVAQTELALRGGCQWVQLRMKHASDEEVVATGLKIRQLCTYYGAKMILDDRVALVKQLHADGVHLGKKDMPVDEARRVLGPGVIIGGTANTIEDIRRLHAWGADYIGCGPFRFTTTKENLAPLLGLEGYRRLTDTMKREQINIPVVAIGGITLADVPDILLTGVQGVAISGSIATAEDPVKATKSFLEAIDKATKNKD